MTRDPISGNNWFAEHMGFRLKQFGQGDIKDKEMIIPNRVDLYGDIRVYCLDTTAKSVEGYTIWITIEDEPSRANTNAKFTVAKHQYNTAYTNQKTRFTNPHHRLTIMFAYPEQEVNDLLVETFDYYSKTPKENFMEVINGVLTAWFATYVFNAKEQKEKRAEYKVDYEKDPIDANRRWRAIVPPNIYGFFMPHFGKINDCANPKLVSPVQVKEIITRRDEMVKGEQKTVNYTALELLNVKGDNRDRYWGGDFAINKDKLVIVGGYGEQTDREVSTFTYRIRNKDGIEEVKETTVNCRPIIDIILVWEAKKPGWGIDYMNVEDTMMAMFRDHFPRSRAFHFDSFQTEGIRQKALDVGVGNCERLSFSNPMQLLYARLFRHLVWNNAVEYLDHALLQTEMHQLILEGNNKVNHPDGGCFVGRTRIPLLDGSIPMIDELNGKEVWVYSSTPEGKIVPGKARGRLTKYVTELVDVILDSGAVERCTPDHRWMLRDGTYKQAQDLKPSIDRLMPINRTWPINGGYERVTNHNYERELTHHMVWTHFNGPLPEGHIVHHLNHIKIDNRPENLKAPRQVDHVRDHTKHRHLTDPEWRDSLYAGAKAFNESAEGRKKHSIAMLKTTSQRNGKDFRTAARKRSTFRRDITLEQIWKIVSNAGGKIKANTVARTLECDRKVIIRVLKDYGFTSWMEYVEGANHKVRAVISVRLDEPVPVYDLEVDEWSNFALSSGVFIHNSKDVWDAVSICNNLICQYGYKGERLSIDTGEDSEEDVDKELDQMLLIFDKGYKDFVDTNQRKPNTNAEMRIWLRARYKVDWSEAMVDMLYQSWVKWVNTLNSRMAKLSIQRTGQVTPQGGRGITGGMEQLASEIEEQLKQQEDDLRSDLRETTKAGGNLII